MHAWYSFVRGVAGSVLRGFFGVTVEGEENIPREGGLLIVANHLSFLDPALVAVAMTREIHFLARKTLFNKNGFGRLISGLNAIPIDRDRPDMNGLRLVIKRCQQGHAVLLFPESTRTPDGRLQPGQSGAGLVALKSEVPILPIRLFGTFEALPRHKQRLRVHPLRAIIGKPFLLAREKKGDKQAYQQAADLVMRKIGELS